MERLIPFRQKCNLVIEMLKQDAGMAFGVFDFSSQSALGLSDFPSQAAFSLMEFTPEQDYIFS